MQLVDKPLVEITLDDIKQAVTDYWMNQLKIDDHFRRDIVVEAGIEPLCTWSEEAFLAFYTDLNLAELVRKQLDLPVAVIAYRKAKYDLVDLSSHIDDWEEEKKLRRLGCGCGSNDVCGKCDQFDTSTATAYVSLEDDEIPF